MKLPVALTLLVLTFVQQGCASLAADLVLRTLFLPLDLALKDNMPTLPTEFKVTEDVKRSKKDWLVAATTERYSFLSHRSRPAYGLRLGYYIGESQSLGLSLRMIQDRKTSEAEPFGEVEHKFRVQTAEIQYAYYYGFAFASIGGGTRGTSFTTRSRTTGDKIYELSPATSPLASLSIGLEYQLYDFTFSGGSQWNVIVPPNGKDEYFSTADPTYFNDTLTKGLAQKSTSSEIFLQVGYSPAE